MGGIADNAARRCLVLDASVIIDYCKEDRSILSLAAQHIGQVVIPSPILKEVTGLDEVSCTDLGLSVYQPIIEQITEAAPRRGQLSFRDRLCLAVARAESYMLYTNDRPLRKAALCDDVKVRWGLEILIELSEIHQIDSLKAITFAENICRRTPFPMDAIMKEFKARLGM